MNDDERLLGFYSGATGDCHGRFLKDLLAWPDEWLEDVHDYIQWLFPLPEPSAFNPRAPLLGRAAIDQFLLSDERRRNMVAAFERMLRFYGLEIVEGGECAIVPAADFAQRARAWLTPMNHNHLRITRILKCLRLVGLGDHARAFFDALSRLYHSQPRPAISAETFRFWRDAAAR